MEKLQVIDLEELLEFDQGYVRSDSSSQFLVWRIIMIKTIETDIGTYYFDSVNFTLSLSPISKQSSPTLDSVEDGVLKK